jgi:hypothetical protein
VSHDDDGGSLRSGWVVDPEPLVLRCCSAGQSVAHPDHWACEVSMPQLLS